jgi:hypothetical protein
MSVEPEPSELRGHSAASRVLDLSGLPAPVADELRKLVAALRENMGQPSSLAAQLAEEPPEAWARRLQAWVDTHPARPVTIDDSRESLYAGRGE